MRTRPPRSIIRRMTTALLMLAATGADAQTSSLSQRVTVVELFTSQGCSSCPPADAFLGALATRPDVVALAFHISYWDKLGWPDPFASEQATQRQSAYARALERRNVYTPQMLIGGRRDVIGSRIAEVENALAQAKGEEPLASLRLEPGSRPGRLRVVVSDAKQPLAAALWLARYDRRHETKVARGENAGRMLTEFNVVRGVVRIGDWQGQAIDLECDDPGTDGLAVLLQTQTPAGDPSRILAAAKLER
jgi:hypothetical protein